MGDDRERAFQQAAHDLVAFRHEDAERGVFGGTLERAIRASSGRSSEEIFEYEASGLES